jgi:hypothetical protein
MEVGSEPQFFRVNPDAADTCNRRKRCVILQTTKWNLSMVRAVATTALAHTSTARANPSPRANQRATAVAIGIATAEATATVVLTAS